jgi:hypothetical protein
MVWHGKERHGKSRQGLGRHDMKLKASKGMGRQGNERKLVAWEGMARHGKTMKGKASEERHGK